MGRRLGRIEQRVAAPHVHHVLQPQVRMLEQMSCLPVDLEGLGVIERIKIEQLAHANQCITTDYTRSCRLPPHNYTGLVGMTCPE